MYKKEDYHTAIRLIRSGKVNLKPLMSKHFPFRDYGEAYKFIEQNRDRTMKVFIDL
jgi:L-iditol 2-dehydrogenase